MTREKKQSSAEVVAEFIGTRIKQPELLMNPETGEPYLIPAEYAFNSEYSDDFERIARAASDASGIVPTPEALTAQATAQLQQQQQQQQQGAPPGEPQQ